ncbi:hypothetical protein HYX58_01675 [Candidatus Dependentiae bacterium]|nr:hypothetical protein [Candidatus Dependentiae bacterium]
MKKINLSLFTIITALSLMPQASLFSMAPQQNFGQPQNTGEFQYINPNLRKVRATGNLQMRTGSQWTLADGTISSDYRWVNITKPEEPSDTMNLESISDENNNNFE